MGRDSVLVRYNRPQTWVKKQKSHYITASYAQYTLCFCVYFCVRVLLHFGFDFITYTASLLA